jgi:hypothetical protein
MLGAAAPTRNTGSWDIVVAAVTQVSTRIHARDGVIAFLSPPSYTVGSIVCEIA